MQKWTFQSFYLIKISFSIWNFTLLHKILTILNAPLNWNYAKCANVEDFRGFMKLFVFTIQSVKIFL